MRIGRFRVITDYVDGMGDAVLRGQRAEALMAEIEPYFDEVRATLTQDILDSAPVEAPLRESRYHMIRALNEVRSRVQRAITNGQYVAATGHGDT